MTRVVFTGYQRVPYMQQTLQSWREVRGVENCIFDFHLEPGPQQMVELCESVDFTESTWIHQNDQVLGVQRNPYAALMCGFDNTAQDNAGRDITTPYPRPDDFVILAEEDLVVASDVLEWFAWAQNLHSDPNVLCVTANQFEEQTGGLSGAVYVPWFHCWVWGTWRDRWEDLIAPDWTFEYEHRGWDWRLNDYWCGEKGMVTAAPSMSRSQHIGQYGGVHTSPALFAEQMSRCYRPDVLPQAYRLVSPYAVQCPMN